MNVLVIIPGYNQVTVPIKFMCLGSDIGGLNRRPLMVIFTLETSTAEVLGRARVDVRVCSCPRRDKATEEEKKNKDEAAIRCVPLTQFYSVDFSKSRISEKVRFHQTHNQGLRQLLLTVSWDLRT